MLLNQRLHSVVAPAAPLSHRKLGDIKKWPSQEYYVLLSLLAKCFAIVLILIWLWSLGIVSSDEQPTSDSANPAQILPVLAGGATLVATKRRTALWRIITCLTNGLTIAGAVPLLFVTSGRPINLVLVGFLFIACGFAIVWVLLAMLAPAPPSDVVTRQPKGDT